MGVYNGTGYFISLEDLKQVKISDIETRYPGIRDIFLKESGQTLKPEENSFLELLRAGGLATRLTIVQYGEPVCFAGIFEKQLDEKGLDPESGDFEMVEKLMAEEGYDYAVSNDTELTAPLEALSAILREFEIIGSHEVLETYWFLMPYPEVLQ